MPKKMGRPPAGTDEAGRAVSTRTYPQITVRVPPLVKRRLDLLAAIEGRTQALVIESALGQYIGSLPASIRKPLDELEVLKTARPARAASEKR
jgi:predicted DNA-binding protein